MAEIELAREELVEKLSFIETYNTEEIQKEADCSAMAPSVGEEANCMEAQLASCPFSTDLKLMDNKLYPIEEQLQYLLRKADEFQNRLVYSEDNAQNEGFTRVVPTFLKTCQPYFNYLESTARNTSPGQSPLPLYIRTRLLQFSQQLCSRLEQLVLTYASYGYLSLAETDPMCVSHFYIGQCQVDNIKLSIFRYCQPTPFLALTSNRLYKRMRWNVERKFGTEEGVEEEKNDNRTEVTQKMEGEQETKKERGMEGYSTEYYFLCYEDVHLVEGEALREQTDRRPGEEAVLRMWSVGKWVRIYPDPDTEDINDWVLCTIPQGQYKPLVYLGEEEPSSCIATDCLLGLLLSQADQSITHPIT
ncbi:hypothetical protein PHYPO_G00153080 [Pangasianodon hypophthalmus]|uniref:Uncharacterized protein n=1 Tax=Pangasianodon hypophthalmus TaxID=310915 RepID=A0A5N5K150_PANHP|nr:UPF0575 protein C19orf67 homolog isoform X1 [Pangasianodon hypophthalmus]KAB5523483.1 hypothetical protein PHYPO_G00153080 [Pangasianodon hypophthalmus]